MAVDDVLSLVSALTLLLSLVFLCMMAAILGFGIYVLRNVSSMRTFLIFLYTEDPLYEPRHEKTCLCHMQTTKAQISRTFKPLPSFCGCAGRFESYLVGNSEDMFSHDMAHIMSYTSQFFYNVIGSCTKVLTYFEFLLIWVIKLLDDK